MYGIDISAFGAVKVLGAALIPHFCRGCGGGQSLFQVNEFIARMLNDRRLHITTEDGTRLNVAILEPLMEELEPLFARRATKIKIQVTPSPPDKITTSTSYEEGGAWHLASHDADDADVLDIFARIRVLAGMSIIPTETQSGKIFVCFSGRLLVLNVTMTADPTIGSQVLTLIPQWAN